LWPIPSLPSRVCSDFTSSMSSVLTRLFKTGAQGLTASSHSQGLFCAYLSFCSILWYSVQLNYLLDLFFVFCLALLKCKVHRKLTFLSVSFLDIFQVPGI
jgi:hypothetical protein